MPRRPTGSWKHERSPFVCLLHAGFLSAPSEKSEAVGHTAHEPQPSTPASKAIEPSPARSRWSEWTLHNSGLYYYRARYISFEDISSIPPTGRNSIVPNVQGGYIHYQSMGVNEGTSQGTSQAPELSTCSTVTTPTASDPPVSTQEVYGQQNDQLVVSAKTTEDSMLMSGALQPEADTTETVVVISNSNALKRKSTTSKKQKEKKKHGKKLDVDKRKQVSNKAKVNKWFMALIRGIPNSRGLGSTLLHLSNVPHHQASPIFTIYQAPAQPRPCVHATTRKLHLTATMTSTIGIPIKLLNEAQGHIVTLEITSGQTYRGKLLDAEDNMNVQLKDITVTARDGRVSHLDQVYIRGSHVRFFIVPDMLRNAPMFRSRNVRGRGVGLARGRATVSRARAGGRGGR
ncbi:unnamed protein product [Fusarium fujikuroi]|nr:unnamed protein product [Fusarium fujikuroi]VZI03970.1 unnamed protein product [Fusarium fujikuroi]